MPIDFTAYTDPGIYIETIDPPVNNTTAITPTVVALIGSAGEEGREVVESTILRSQYSSTLSAEGINPYSLKVKNRFNLEQYTSAFIGTVKTLATAGATSIVVTAKSNFSPEKGIANSNPVGDSNTRFEVLFRILIDNQVYDVKEFTISGDDYSFTVPAISTVIKAGSTVNLVAPYIVPLKVGTFNTSELSAQSNLTSSTTDFRILQYKKAIQRLRITKASVGNTTDLKVAFDYTGTTYDFTNIDVIVDGVYKTAFEILEAILVDSEDFTDLVSVTRTENTTYVDYTFVFGIDSPVSLGKTDTGAVATISSIGLTAGDTLVIDKERVFIDSVTTITSGDTELLDLTVTRGSDGTVATSHGKVDIYFASGYDYYVVNDSGDDSEFNGVDDRVLLSAVPGARLAPLDSEGNVSVSAESIEIKANSTDAKQYSVEVFTDLDNIRAKYGKPTSNTETPVITSNLTFAAQLALRNGANRVYCVGVTTNTVEGFEEAIDKLANLDEINVIVPVTAGLNIVATEQVVSKLKDFCESQASQGNLVRGFVAIDGNATSLAASDFSSLAERIADSRISLVAPGRFTVNTGSGKISAGGPFAAAALAGLHAKLDVQMPLTRKQLELSVSGIEDPFTGREMIDLQSKGVLVLFQESSGRITVRHGLTTDMTSVYSQEISVVAARDRLRDLVYNALSGSGILGSPITASTPELVVSNITSALETAKLATLIFDYADIKYRVPTNNPTAIEIRFAYRPTMPLNYVLVQFSVDTSSSSVTFQSITEGGV